jgi:hypothetical protein
MTKELWNIVLKGKENGIYKFTGGIAVNQITLIQISVKQITVKQLNTTL